MREKISSHTKEGIYGRSDYRVHKQVQHPVGGRSQFLGEGRTVVVVAGAVTKCSIDGLVRFAERGVCKIALIL